MAIVAIAVALLAGCGNDGHPVDPLTQRLADICGLDAQDLRYASRGASGYGGPPPYVWQTQDARHSVELAFPAGVRMSDDGGRMFVSCDDDGRQQSITVTKRELPRESGISP
jgi:hypothetical protein